MAHPGMLILLAEQWPLVVSNGTFPAILLCAGLAIGLALGRLRYYRNPVTAGNSRQMAGLISHLVKGIADDMSEYRSVVLSASKLFRDSPFAEDSQKSEDAASLLECVVDANEQLQQRLNEAEEELQEQSRKISSYMSEARTDPLTGLLNRRAFEEELNRRMSERKRHETDLSVLMIDIDHFKKFNDRYGHQAGDAVLRQVAELLCETMRESDVVTRFGGEEMAVILARSEIREACLAANRAREAVQRAHFVHDGRPLHVTISLGAAECLADESKQQLVERADQALYAAKQTGRDRTCWHDGLRCRAYEPNKIDGNEEVTVDLPTQRVERSPSSGARRPGSRDTHSFASICQDLRQRLDAVAAGDSRP